MRLQLNHSSGLIRAAHMMSCLFAPLLNLKNNRSSKNALLSFVIQRLHGCSEEMDSIRGSYGTVNQANIKEYISMLIAKAVKAKGNMALSVLFLFSDFVLNLSCNVLYCIVLYCIVLYCIVLYYKKDKSVSREDGSEIQRRPVRSQSLNNYSLQESVALPSEISDAINPIYISKLMLKVFYI
jgi:hypothetical protein